ncbi:MAG: hypothetical protein C5B49_06460 [Bdellovibrio sp.]|nr:MAG: hypothetical protein C5B49_06460 [Bdellovibrio sp.]
MTRIRNEMQAVFSMVIIAASIAAPIALFQNCTTSFRLADSASTATAGNVTDGISGKTCGDNYSPGHSTIHRLTNIEYNNTVRDLVYTSSTPADSFPPPVAGISGYTNDSTALQISDPLVQKYYSAAQSLAAEVIASKGTSGGAYARISPCGIKISSATPSSTSASCAQSTIQSFATRGYRRPITDAELSSLSAIFNMGSTFDQGLANLITAVLISPKFLFVSITGSFSASAGVPFAIDDYQLASRLSYFLWQSMPDDQLMQLASAGQLNSDATLGQQVQRMLLDSKSQSFRLMLRDEWLSLATIALPVTNLDDSIRQSMITEADMFLQDLIQSNHSFVNLFSANYSFMNKALADYYGLGFTGSDPTQFQKVSYNDQRLGVLSQGGFLTATGGLAAEASIVRRGKALASAVFCTPPAPPPKPPPDLNNDPTLTGNPRQRLVAATANSPCIGCHMTLNNLGFGLLNFSSFGQYRTTYTTFQDTIDSSGSLPGVVTFSNGMDMLRQLPTLEQVQACFPQQLMNIATTRAATSVDDRCVQRNIGAVTSTAASTFSDVISSIVLSRQFRMQTGEGQ